MPKIGAIPNQKDTKFSKQIYAFQVNDDRNHKKLLFRESTKTKNHVFLDKINHGPYFLGLILTAIFVANIRGSRVNWKTLHFVGLFFFINKLRYSILDSLILIMNQTWNNQHN